MGRYSSNGMSGSLSTPRGRAMEDWQANKMVAQADMAAFINGKRQDGESHEDATHRLIKEGVLEARYPRGTEPKMSLDEMKKLAAEAIANRKNITS